MSGMSRRDLLRASAGAAAVAVPMSALSAGGIAAASGAATRVADRVADEAAITEAGSGPVVFSIKNPSKGEVSVLQGADEVVVRDRQLVARILRAADTRRGL